MPIVLRATMQGLGHLPMQVIVTTGHNRDPIGLDLGPRADNIWVEQWIPHSILLPHVDVVITAGGAGTVLASLDAGVPLIVIPTETDQPDNARRVVEAGAGLCLPKWRCTPERLRLAVERILSEPAYRQNAERVTESFARYNGATRAAELLETLHLTNRNGETNEIQESLCAA